VQLFERALASTTGDDLQQILWLKSPSSEVWFDRRTNYTRSMACMSMVGYILGLGDRDPALSGEGKTRKNTFDNECWRMLGMATVAAAKGKA
ncbi:hypothetical protein OSTOST_24204, partial [Ostertagia ostertagi]